MQLRDTPLPSAKQALRMLWEDVVALQSPSRRPGKDANIARNLILLTAGLPCPHLLREDAMGVFKHIRTRDVKACIKARLGSLHGTPTIVGVLPAHRVLIPTRVGVQLAQCPLRVHCSA